jgi:hypothetical protein
MPIRLATTWGDEVKKEMEVQLRRNGLVLTGLEPGNGLTSAVFAGFDHGAPLIVIGTVSYFAAPSGFMEVQFNINNVFRHPQHLMLSEPTSAAEIVGDSPRAKQWMSELPFSADPLALSGSSYPVN